MEIKKKRTVLAIDDGPTDLFLLKSVLQETELTILSAKNGLKGMEMVVSERPDLILAAWSDIIGPKLAPMTQAVSFYDGKLFGKVKNSTLFSLLNQHDKPKLLFKLKQQFPKHNIKNIVFKMG